MQYFFWYIHENKTTFTHSGSYEEAVNSFIKLIADILAKDNYGKTVLDYVSSYEVKYIIFNTAKKNNILHHIPHS